MCSSNASWVMSTSPGSSSTSRTSMGVADRSRHVLRSVRCRLPVRSAGTSAIGKRERGSRCPSPASESMPDARRRGYSTIFLTMREPDAGARVGLPGVQPLEDHEDLLGVLRLDADAVVAHDDLATPSSTGAPTWTVERARRDGGTSARCRSGSAKSVVEQRLSPADGRAGRTEVIVAPGLVAARVEVARRTSREQLRRGRRR